MPWWGKSTKEGEKKPRKGSAVDTSHGKFKIVSVEKGGRSGISRRRYIDIVSENADNSSVNYRHPSHFHQVSSSRNFSGKSSAQPVQLQGVHHSSTHLVQPKFGRSKRTGCERVSQPSVLRSFYKPRHIVNTADGKYIVMEFKTASVFNCNSSGCDNPTHRHPITNRVPGNATTRKAATNCPSSSSNALKDKSTIVSNQNTKEIRRPSNLLLNNQGVFLSPKRQPRGANVLNIQIPPVSASVSAPNSSLSSPLVTPRKAIRHEPLRNYGFGPGNSHASICPLGSGHCSAPNSGPIFEQRSVGGDVPELIFRQHNNSSPERSPPLSFRMASAGPSSRVNSAAVTALHPSVAGAPPEPPTTSSSYKKKQSHRLPLPPVITSSPIPMLPSYPTNANSQVPQSSVQADNLPSPGPQWKKGRLLGSGTFGRVYLGFNNESGDMCAMKEVTLFSDDPKSEEGAQQLGQEIELLSQLHHPNIVQYYGSEKVDENVYIYLEYVPGGSIHKVLKDYGPLGESALRSFTKQILSGLAYLHAKNTAHRDVKGANILLQPGGFVKLADFGMAKHMTGEIGPMSFKGSPHWIAPEVIKHSNADVSVDIWSLGCTVLEMATGKPPWGHYEGVAALFKIGNSEELPSIPDSLSVEGKDFIRKCLQRDPLQRPTAAQLLEHPFVKSFTPLERHDPCPEPVEAMHLATNTGSPQSRNPQFLDTGAIYQTRGSKMVTPISNVHSRKDTPCLVSPTVEVLPQPQAPATRLTPCIGPDAGEIQFHHPRTPHHMSERFSSTSIATPWDTPSSSTPLAAGNLMPCHHPQSSKHRHERLSNTLISSSRLASGPSAYLPGGNGSLPFTKSPTKNRHGDPVSILRPHTSSYSSADTSYESVKPDMFEPVPQSHLIAQVIDMHSSVRRDQTGSNVRGHPSELANWVPLQWLGKQVKFNLP